MNFDGKAFVKNTTVKTFASILGYAQVRDSAVLDIDNLCLTTGYDTAFILPVHTSNPHDNLKSKIQYSSGLIPYTAQVRWLNEEIKQEIEPQTFMVVNDNTVHDVQNSFLYKPQHAYVAKLQPTNIKYNPKSAIVIDSEQKESVMSFAGTSVDVRSKVEVVIPDKPTDYSDMSLVIQKNCFIEIKMPESVKDVVNIPDSLIYLPGYIKGTFTKSGEYNIKIKYPDGEQILNIIVPYYQRML